MTESPTIRCCEHCFVDQVLVEHIHATGVQGKCAYCEHDCQHTSALEEIAPRFKHICALYRPLITDPPEQARGDLSLYHPAPLPQLIAKDWKIFSEHLTSSPKLLELTKAIVENLEAFEGEPYDVHRKFIHRVAHYPNEHAQFKWMFFEGFLKHRSRFMLGSLGREMSNLLQQIMTPRILEEMSQAFPELVAYRARHGNVLPADKNLDDYRLLMGPPPAEKATAGRANPSGISVVYLASSEHTAVAEVRAFAGQQVTVVKVRSTRDLNLIDLRDRKRLAKLSPFLCNSSDDIQQRKLAAETLELIGRKMSLPVQSHDAPIDYVPTQYIAEYIASHKYHGLVFDSALDLEGYNIVLFSDDNLEYTDRKLMRVLSIALHMQEDVVDWESNSSSDDDRSTRRLLDLQFEHHQRFGDDQ